MKNHTISIADLHGSVDKFVLASDSKTERKLDCCHQIFNGNVELLYRVTIYRNENYYDNLNDAILAYNEL